MNFIHGSMFQTPPNRWRVSDLVAFAPLSSQPLAFHGSYGQKGSMGGVVLPWHWSFQMMAFSFPGPRQRDCALCYQSRGLQPPLLYTPKSVVVFQHVILHASLPVGFRGFPPSPPPPRVLVGHEAVIVVCAFSWPSCPSSWTTIAGFPAASPCHENSPLRTNQVQ